MFYLTYVRRELSRRRTRTVLSIVGLAIGVGMVIGVSALSSGLDRAQGRVLNPLGSVGTDLVVSRQVPLGPPVDGAAPLESGRTKLPTVNASDYQAVLKENQQAVTTDLSKLGKPGDHFVHDFFLPANQLTFPSDQVGSIASLPGVAGVSQGLMLLATHQEGTVPQIVAEFQTGGETINVDRTVQPASPGEQTQIQACIEKAHGGPLPQQQVAPGAAVKGQAIRIDTATIMKCLPERFRHLQTSVTTPTRTVRQVLNPPQTDITSESYVIAGVELGPSGMGLITPAQIFKGHFFSTADAREAIVSEAYAERKKLAVDSTLSLNGNGFTVVGLARPPLGGPAADLYVPLVQLQELSGRSARINLLLVRAKHAGEVEHLVHSIEAAFPGAQVTSAQELARQVSGSLLDAARLAQRLGLLLAGLVLSAAFLTAALLTLTSVAKRVREIGTLKALGWPQSAVVRQVLAESVALGAAGGVCGVFLGLGVALAVAHFAPALEASAPTLSGPSAAIFGTGVPATHVSRAAARIRFDASFDPLFVVSAMGMALVGSVLAAGVGALRAARLRPAVALRSVE